MICDQHPIHIVSDFNGGVLMFAEKGENVIENHRPGIVQLDMKVNSLRKECQTGTAIWVIGSTD